MSKLKHENDKMKAEAVPIMPVESDDPMALPKQFILANNLLSDGAKNSIVKGESEV